MKKYSLQIWTFTMCLWGGTVLAQVAQIPQTFSSTKIASNVAGSQTMPASKTTPAFSSIQIKSAPEEFIKAEAAEKVGDYAGAMQGYLKAAEKGSAEAERDIALLYAEIFKPNETVTHVNLV
jgi:hypothetical protein